MISIETFPLQATAVYRKNEFGNGGSYFYLRLPSAPVNVQLMRNGEVVTKAAGVVDSLKLRIPLTFTSFAIQFVSGAAGNVVVGIGDEDFDIASSSENVNAFQQGGSGNPSAADVVTVNAAATLLLPANAARKSAVVRALHTNVGWHRIGDVNVAAGQGLECGPSEAVTLDSTGAIYVWGTNNGDKFSLEEILA